MCGRASGRRSKNARTTRKQKGRAQTGECSVILISLCRQLNEWKHGRKQVFCKIGYGIRCARACRLFNIDCVLLLLFECDVIVVQREHKLRYTFFVRSSRRPTEGNGKRVEAWQKERELNAMFVVLPVFSIQSSQLPHVLVDLSAFPSLSFRPLRGRDNLGFCTCERRKSRPFPIEPAILERCGRLAAISGTKLRFHAPVCPLAHHHLFPLPRRRASGRPAHPPNQRRAAA